MITERSWWAVTGGDAVMQALDGALKGRVWEGPGVRIDFADLIRSCRAYALAQAYDEWCGRLAPSLFMDPGGIHGTAHAGRVLMLGLILSRLRGLGPDDTAVLGQASLFHDIGRTHNGRCTVHGLSSYKKMVGLNVVEGITSGEREILRYVIENHCVSDHSGYENVAGYGVDRDRAVDLLRLFKDCDNLDRVRLGDLDTGFLRNPYSPGLVEVAGVLLGAVR